MPLSQTPGAALLTRMADGTVKQANPFTGTQVWTVPGRGHRPLGTRAGTASPLDPSLEGRYCALCHRRYLETPPEKARLVRAGDDDGPPWRTLLDVPAARLFDQVAELRRVPNLFEILSFDYWRANHGYDMPAGRAAAMASYLATADGRAHVLAVARARLLASGVSAEQWEAMSEPERLSPARAFFGGGHELVVARRHYVDGAVDDSALASSGTLTPQEHERYTAFTVDALRAVYDGNRHVRYVAVWQNWLRPAGASFDHLHKQLAALDERGAQAERELALVRQVPNVYNDATVNDPAYRDLVVAENEHAVAFAGVGHRYPSLEVYSKSAASAPWEHTPEEVRGVSDLLHACHAATGADVPCNEEWHHRPVGVEAPMPWRLVLKWRLSTLAGFEGSTKIYLNTIDPWALRDRVVSRLRDLREQGRIAAMDIAGECPCRADSLRYAAQAARGPRPVPER